MSEIRREVEKSKAESAELEALKEQVFSEDQRLQPIRKEEAARQARIAIEEARVSFRDGLRRALSEPEDQSGPAIDAVCQDHGVIVQAGKLDPGTATGLGLTSTGRRERVEKLRARGVSEAAIFDELARLESRNRAARNGPKSRQEVLVRAARQLLSVPLASRNRVAR